MNLLLQVRDDLLRISSRQLRRSTEYSTKYSTVPGGWDADADARLIFGLETLISQLQIIKWKVALPFKLFR